MLENFKNWKTTVLGICTALITILVATGVIDPLNEQELNMTVETIVTASGTVVAGIASLWLMFKSKDKEKD